VGPRAGLDRCGKSRTELGFDSRPSRGPVQRVIIFSKFNLCDSGLWTGKGVLFLASDVKRT
jgi:hypothetical protein